MSAFNQGGKGLLKEGKKRRNLCL